MYIKESSENLVAYDLNVHGCEPFSACLTDKSKEVSIIASHHYIQILPSFLDSSIAAKYLHQKITFEHIDNLNLPIFILRVLKNLLNGNYLTSPSNSTLKNFTESSLSNNLN